jgi:hypothetical protein
MVEFGSPESQFKLSESQETKQAEATPASTTSSKIILKTEKGMVNKEAVKKLTLATIPQSAPKVNRITTNQSQEFFAVATSQGFEII